MTSILQKIVVLGEGGVGKSALIIQYVQNHFVVGYDPTIEDSFRKQVNIGDHSYMLDIVDTAGQEAYSVLREQYIRTGGGFVLVYSISNRETYNMMEDFRETVLRVKEKTSLPMILVGNKCDLTEQRVVSTEEGKKLAQKFGCPFIEASAKLRIHIDEIFMTLLELMRKHGVGDPGLLSTSGPVTPRSGRSYSAVGDTTNNNPHHFSDTQKKRPQSTQIGKKKRRLCVIS